MQAVTHYITWDNAAIVAVTLIAFSIGAKFADVDLAPVFPLRHRSAWTHGVLLPAVLAWWVAPLHPLAWWAVVGFLPSYALHLFADSFPQKWHGSALIKFFPLPWSLNGLLSFVWIMAGALASVCALAWLAGIRFGQ